MQRYSFIKKSLLAKLRSLHLGIQAKLLATAIPTLLLFTIVVSLGIVERENNIIYNDTVQQGLSIANSAALLYTNARIYEELNMVDSSGMSEYLEYFMADLMRLDPRMRNFFILNAQGQVLAHNNLREYGKIYNDAKTLKLLTKRQEFVEEIHTQDGQNLLQITVPLAIGSKFWGLCRLDFSLNEMYAYNANLRNEIILLSIFFLLLSIGIVWLAGRNFITPIQQLTDNMNTITLKGEVKKDLPKLPKREDEIGELQDSFTWMLARLHQVEEERLQDIERMLQAEKLAAVGQLASGLAHEINNPLGGTILCFQNLCEGDMTEDMRSQHINVINKSLEKIRSTVNSFLRFARPAPLSMGPTSIHQVFNHCKNLADYTLSQHGTSIHMDVLSSIPDVQLDFDKIEQVLLNLILNADYSMINDCPNNKNLAILLKAYIDNQNLFIIVADTGLGIKPEIQDKIFNPFFSTKPEGKGTGLGLAVSSTIIAQHGGSLKIADNCTPEYNGQVYSGAVFEIKIPLNANTTL